MPPDPPTVNDCRAAMFSTSANEIAPQMVNVMYGPGFKRWLDLNFSYYTAVEYINSSFKCVRETNSFCLHAGKKSGCMLYDGLRTSSMHRLCAVI